MSNPHNNIKVYDCKIYDSKGSLKEVVKGSTIILRDRASVLQMLSEIDLSSVSSIGTYPKNRKTQEIDTTVNCVHCKKDFLTRSSFARRARFCSRLCNSRSKLAGKRAGPYTKNCRMCEKEFVTDFVVQVTCSDECRAENHRVKDRARSKVARDRFHKSPPVACPYCKTMFKRSSPKQKFCTKLCCQTAHNDQRYSDEKLMPMRFRACDYCLDNYRTTDRDSKFCGKECSDNYAKHIEVLS